MDPRRFSPQAPGELVKISPADWAFLPAPLPPNWRLPERLWPLLAEARQQLGTLEGIGFNLPNPDILLRPLQKREALRSSSLEGTFATPQELLLFELEPVEAKTETPDGITAFREVANYGLALRHGASSELPLSLRLIRDMHRILLTGVRGTDQTPGEFRRGQVHIGHDKRFIPPPLNHLPECLDRLERYLHVNDGLDPLVRSYLVHYQFETIHPFYDGNGRVGRLLLALMTQQACKLTKPWLYMSAFFDRYKDEYISKLFNVSAAADWDSWIEFCLRGTVQQALDTIKRCTNLLRLKDEFAAKLHSIKGTVRLSAIVDDLFESPILRITSVAKRLGVSYPTAKSDVERLARAGILKLLNRGVPRTYYASRIFDIAFEEENRPPTK